MIRDQAERIRALQLEAKNRRRDPKFALLSRAAAAALSSSSLSPLLAAKTKAGASAEDVIFTARAHGISGLLSRLELEGPERFEPEISDSLKMDRESIRARARRLSEDLAGLARRAETSGLPVIPLKGAILGPLHYKDVSLRPASDLDLLATGRDFEAWTRILSEEGYTRTGETFKHRVFEKPADRVIEGFGEHPDNPRPIELHPALKERILGREFEITEAYTQGLRAEKVHGIPMLVPSCGGLFLHLVLHLAPAALGRGARLIQFHDLATLSPTAQEMDLVGSRLDEIGWATSVLATREFPPAIPAPLVEKLRSVAPASRSRRDRFLSRPGLLTGEHDLDVLSRVDLRLCRSPFDAARRLIDTLPEKVVLESSYGVIDSPARHCSALLRYVIDRVRSGGASNRH